jgi:hypothetical protein
MSSILPEAEFKGSRSLLEKGIINNGICYITWRTLQKYTNTALNIRNKSIPYTIIMH